MYKPSVVKWALCAVGVGLGVGTAVALEIVLPEKPGRIERYAAEELKYHLEKATGDTVVLVSESASKSASNRLFVGRTAAVARLGIDVATLKDEERIVKGVGSDVYFVGGDRISDANADLGDWNGQIACGTLYAVYDFLEKDMGVKWLWPGETGEVVPRRPMPNLAGVERRGREPLERRHYFGWKKLGFYATDDFVPGWANPTNAVRERDIRIKWLVRHRLGSRRVFNGEHAFSKWWGKYGKEHPEYFSQLPDGVRGPFEGDPDGNFITMCVSQPALWRQIVADWRNSPRSKSVGSHYIACVNCCENDSPGMCTCAACRAWDPNDPKFAQNDYWNGSGKVKMKFRGRNRILAEAQWGEDGGTKTLYSTPQLSDRYAKFYNAVLAEARKFVPEAVVYGYAYSNYRTPPKETKVSDGVIISYVPRTYFPYTEVESRSIRSEWMGWHAAGARQMHYRPNFLHSGANLPYDMARRILDDFACLYTNGMTSIGYDSLRPIWSAQAMNNYAVTRAMREPLIGYERALDEFASAFHPAEKEIKDYCAHLESVGRGLTTQKWQKLAEENCDSRGNVGGSFKNFVLMATALYDEDWFTKAEALLDRAAAKLATQRGVETEEAVRRVDFLRKGLADGRLTYRARVAQKSGDKAAFTAAFKTLVDYRASVEADGICGFNGVAFREATGAEWPHRMKKPKSKK